MFRKLFRGSPLAVTAIGLLGGAAVLAPTATRSQAAAPAKCPQGQVWREAYPGDYVCVTRDVRAKARANRARTCASGQVPQQADGICAPAPATAIAPGPVPAPAVPTVQSNVAQVPFLGVSGPRPFLIIAPDEFMAALEPLVAHKNSTGMPTLAVSIGQLTSHFPGADDPEKIKRGARHRDVGVTVDLVGIRVVPVRPLGVGYAPIGSTWRVNAISAPSICRRNGNTGRTTSTIREWWTTTRRRGSTSASW